MTEDLDHIVLGGGCFWCLEAVYKRIEGVVTTRPGYAGGYLENPDYKTVCAGDTGHAEVVEIGFRPSMLSLNAVLDIFWMAHDPTTPDRQGNDVGPQYRSIILYANQTQKTIAEASMAALERSNTYSVPPVTQIVPLETFWPAEAYHKDYFEGNRTQGYCRLVIAPKLRKLNLMKD
ncbi:MAG: peptide-methionine (S)-S-oxide reductase MsrA [Spirochaetales bacterium]|nr:peptide-methionine (S)-S-oxide reductase MsrA [Spirochaetales bacterium]